MNLLLIGGLCFASPALPHHFFSYLCFMISRERRVGRLVMKDARSSRMTAGLLREAGANSRSPLLTITVSPFRLLMLKAV